MAAITVTETKVRPVFADRCRIRPYRYGTGGIIAGQPVYVDATTGLAGKASANTTGAKNFRGIALSTQPQGGVGDVLEDGWLEGAELSGLAYDAQVFLGNTAGSIDTAAGATSIPVGLVVPLSDRDPATKKPSKILRVHSIPLAVYA